MSASKQTFVDAKGDPASHASDRGRTTSFVLDGEYFYQSLGGDTGKSTLTLSSSTLQDIVKDKLLPQWSPVAASVFRDQAGQLVDLYGYENNGGNMSQAGFDAYFNMSASGNTKYSDETWSCYSLRDKLKQTWASHAGDPGWDQLTVTGVKRVNSLNEARDLVGQALYDCENHKGLEASEFLDVDEGNGSTRLEGLDDESSTTAFVNIVTSVNCKGSSADFDYVSFGIVFYDFEPVPVAAHGLQYNMGTVDVNTADKGENSTVISNGQQQDVMHSAKLGDAVTETTSTTLSGLASFNLKENIGANIGWSETESYSSTEFNVDDESAGAETSTSSSTQSLGLNWGAAWEMGGALGAEMGHSKSQEVSKAVETTIALPPHTAAGIDHKTTTTTYGQNYQQPVILNYKVAIFAVSGDFYSGGNGGINSGSYDKQSLVIKFDTKAESGPSYGCAATDDLYSRTVTNRSVSDYDVAAGRTYTTHSTASGWNKSTDINWDNVISTAKNHYGAEIVGNVNANGDFAKKGVARFNYFYETPGKLDVVQDKTTSKASSLYPLYDLAYVTAPKTNYTVYSGSGSNGVTYDLGALAATGYNRYGVPFYGFDSSWGQWRLCKANGETAGVDYSSIVTLDEENNELTTKQNAHGTIYLTWVAKDLADAQKPKTGDSLEGQNLRTSQIEAPIVTVEILDTSFNNPEVTAEGSYTGFYGTSINLNNVMTYEVYDEDNVIIETPVMWQSQEPASRGIKVDEATGKVEFTKPGTYHVRPYVMTNATIDGQGQVVWGSYKVYPVNDAGKPEWLTVVTTEHNLTYYEEKAPTDCVGGDAYGWIGHYRCSDCGKYFLDAAGTLEVPADKVIIEATGHKWGEWKTIDEPEGDTPGVQQRVCQNRANHVETRNLYTVQFDMNGGAVKDEKGNEQKVVSKTVFTGGSVAPPEAQPTQKGYTFEGWFTSEHGGKTLAAEPYDFSSTVTGNMTLYAKWAPQKYTVVTSGVIVVTGIDGEQKISPAATCKIGISTKDSSSDALTFSDEDGYTYCYMEVETGATVTLTVKPGTYYTFDTSANPGNTIQAALLNTSNWSTDEPVTLKQDSTNPMQYSLEMPAADVAVAASFSQEKVTITYNENLPGGKKAEEITGVGKTGKFYKKGTSAAGTTTTVNLSDFLAAPNDQTVSIDANSSFTPLLAGTGEETPTLSWSNETTTNPAEVVTYTFGGWYTDSKCTKPFLSSKVTRDMTLYAKWNKVGTDTAARKVTYTLLYASSPSDSLSYQAEVGSTVYDPTDDLYAIVGDNALKAYELETDKNGSCWFEAGGSTQTYNEFSTAKPYDFSKPIAAGDGEIHLYAKVKNRTYTVTYFDGEKQLGAQEVLYEGTIGTVDKDVVTTKAGCTLSGWVTKDGDKWNLTEKAVKSDQALYAAWSIEVTFDANGHGTAPDAQTVEYDSVAVGHDVTVSEPKAPTAEGYTFGGWFTDKECTKAYDFTTPVKDSFTLYAKWTAEKRTVTFDANGHGKAPDAQIVDYDTTVTKPADPTADSFTFGGWFTDKECTTAYDFATPVTSNMTLYAKWTANVSPVAEKHTVTFDANGHGTAPAAQTVADGDKAQKPDDPAAVSGYEFGGWYKEAACTTAYDFASPVTNDLKLYAKWTEVPSVTMFRLYNQYSGEHFYTGDAEERDGLVVAGWTDEGIGWMAPETSDTPVYRLYNSFSPMGDHHYTMDKAEYDALVEAGWTGEEIGWYSDDLEGVQVYRQYNPYAYELGMSGAHNYTISKDENDILVLIGWLEEGTGWYGLAVPVPTSEGDIEESQDLVAAAI